MKNAIKIFLITTLLLLFCTQLAVGQDWFRSTKPKFDTAFTFIPKPMKKYPWRAAAEVVVLNLGVNAFDRYVLKGDYAYVNWSTIKNNFETGFVWDNDGFSTNLLSHPYHGNLYFTSARSNGLNFWASCPYALGGSLMWEFFMENEPPSINDIFSTSIGGAALGEILYRSSSLVLDDTKRGFERVAREFCGAVIAPMRAFNRLTRGEIWRVMPDNTYYGERVPFSFEVGAGWRYIAQNNYLFKGSNGMFIDLAMTYGDPFHNDTYKPFDFFTIKAMFNAGGGQPFVGSVNALGMIWGKSIEPAPGHDMTLGIFQHFDFYQTDTLKNSCIVPFELAESAAIGGGLMYRFPEIGHKINLSYNLYANLILMGGTLTDYFLVNDRNYNLGSGYSLKFQTALQFGDVANFFVGVEHYQLYTWKGYDSEPNPIPPDTDIKYLNAQGNRGNTRLTLINPKLEINISKNLKIGFDAYLYFRDSHYDFFEDVAYRTFETRLGVFYTI